MTVVPTIGALLDVARDLVVRRRFDAEVVLVLLSKLPIEEVDVQTRGAIKHAQLTTAAARLINATEPLAKRSICGRRAVDVRVHYLLRSIIRKSPAI